MLMLAAIMIPVIGGIAIYAVSSDGRSRNALYAVCMLLTDAAVIAAAFRSSPIVLAQLSEGIFVAFRADTLGRCFLAVALIQYTCILFYSFEYMKMEERLPSFTCSTSFQWARSSRNASPLTL